MNYSLVQLQTFRIEVRDSQIRLRCFKQAQAAVDDTTSIAVMILQGASGYRFHVLGTIVNKVSSTTQKILHSRALVHIRNMLQIMVVTRQITAHIVFMQQWPQVLDKTLSRPMLGDRPHRKMTGHE